MNWMQNLLSTYDNCQSSIGYANQNDQRPLLPICHSTNKANIEIVIDDEGIFRRAQVVVDKDDATTIIPCTESSASRSGKKPENHPLCDRLQYIAGDFCQFDGLITSGFSKDREEPYRNYEKTLTEWCSSDYAHPKAQAVLKYIKKKRTIHDLLEVRILSVDGQRFLKKGEVPRKNNQKDIFSVVASQENAFIRWIVESPNDNESRVWRDKTLWDSWIKYYFSIHHNQALCMVTGKNQVTTINHPKYIRKEGDGAKLISSNDTNGFTYRGHFITDKQACGVGLEVSQKSHYALSWLISRQGYKKGDLAIVAWATSGTQVPQPTDDPINLLFGNSPTEEELISYTAQEIAIPLRNKMAGYYQKIGETERIAIIALDSASKGRLSITYYRDLKGSDFLQRIETWHTTCAWLHRYRYIKDPISGKPRYIPFYGAPSPADIAEAAYGKRLDEKILKATISRLIPCIIDGQPIPRDIVESTIRRSSNRVGQKEWEWEKALSIACALFRKFREKKEDIAMPLDETRTTRDYLYGRLLAIADILEEKALYKSDQKRATNAARYMQQFSQNPFRTWKQIHDSLSPYFLKLNGAHYYKEIIAEVESKFLPDDYLSNKPLTGEYLLGYYCQREQLLVKKKKNNSSIDENE